MADHDPARPPVSIVVVPRERFSIALRSLRSLIACTEPGYELIYVDAGSPPAVRDGLAAMAARHGFRLIRDERPLSPTQARNIGRAAARGELVVFADNDLLVTPGWLPPLVACARETGAALVSPLILYGEPRDGAIHFGGGELVVDPGPPPRQARERHALAGCRLAELAPGTLVRRPTDFGEFHCVLISRAALDRLPPFDEGLLSMSEHLDVALELRQQGGSMVLEPASRVVGYDGGPFTLADAVYAGMRWGEPWNQATHDRFAAKWGIARDSRFFADQDSFLVRQQRRAGLPLAPPRGPLDGPFAQTGIQLLNELQAAGLPSADLRLVRRACDIAALLHGDTLRPSGKPFLAHLVGTASVLARYGAPAGVVAAGLLHAAYSHGRFPGIAGEVHSTWRAWLRGEVGGEVESVLDHYYRIRFDAGDGALGEDAIDALPLPVAFTVMVRVANEIEERLDGALRYGEKWTLPLPPPVMQLFERVLGRLGAAGLVDLLRRMAAADGAPPVDPAMTLPVASSYRPSPETGEPELVEIRHPRLWQPLRAAADPLDGIAADAALIGIAVLRDDGDVVEEFVRANLALLDGLLVADQGSADDTPAILERLRAAGLRVAVAQPDVPGRPAVEVLHGLIDLVRQFRAPAFLLPLEAGEILQAGSRDALLASLHAAAAAGVPSIDRARRQPAGAEAGGGSVGRVVLTAGQLGDEFCRVVKHGAAILDGGGRRLAVQPVPGIALARVPRRAAPRPRGEEERPAAKRAAASAILAEVAAELDHCRRQLAAAEREAADRRREAEALRASTSWRLTAPLRAVVAGWRQATRRA
ncbi:MAG: glycosyltransferase [Dongiaceae bacterium]